MNAIEKMIIKKSQRISSWHTQKLYYNTARVHQRKWTVKKGEVYFVDLGENIGSEENKIRPVVVVSNGLTAKSPVFICAVISTSTISHQNIQVPITGNYPYVNNKGVNTVLSGAVDLGQIRSVAKERIVSKKICTLTHELPDIDRKIMYVLGLNKSIAKKERYISSLEGKIEYLKNQLGSS